jgi:hypothetical protein
MSFRARAGLVLLLVLGAQSHAQKVDWAPVPGAEAYEYQIATDPDFESAKLMDSGSTEQSSLSLNLPPGAYFYRIRSVDGEGRAGVWSAAQKFVVSSNTLRVSSPTNGAELVLDSRQTPVSFSWSTVEGASSYELIISSQRGRRTVVSSAPAVSVADLSPGSYSFRVVARSRGIRLTESAAQNFRIRFLTERERSTTDAQRLTWINPQSVLNRPIVWEFLDFGVGWMGLSQSNPRLNKQEDPDENGVVDTQVLQPSLSFGSRLTWNAKPNRSYFIAYRSLAFGVLSERQAEDEAFGIAAVPTAMLQQSVDLGWTLRSSRLNHHLSLGWTSIDMLAERVFLKVALPFVQFKWGVDLRFSDQAGFVPFLSAQIEQPLVYLGPKDLISTRVPLLVPAVEFRAGVLRGVVNTILVQPSLALRLQHWSANGGRTKHTEFQSQLKISLVWAP